ncbi:protein kinase [Chloroflexota bacterium]
MTLERGALLHNRYRIIEILGQGGMGSIYRAIDDNLGVEVAVKENLFTTEEYARQFRREAVILASMKHPNLPRVSDHFVIDGQGQYLVMDFIEGEDLRERMDRVPSIPESEVIVVGVAICDAMLYMHSQRPPVLHRDIKPGNVRIAPNGHIYLVDFGLAKIVQGGQQTATGARAMTPGYSPPEQYGAARTDHRSDVFSLGATLYASLTGAIPEDSLARTMEQMELTPLRKRNPKVSRRLASAVEKALSVHPDDRFQSAEEFKAALLSARGITLRRFAEQGTLPPYSLKEDNPNFDDTAPNNNDPAIGAQMANDRSSLPLPSSTPLPSDLNLNGVDLTTSSSKRSRRNRKRGCLLTILIFLSVVLLVSTLVVRDDRMALQNQVREVYSQGLMLLGSLTPDLVVNNQPSPTTKIESSIGGDVGNVTTITPNIDELSASLTMTPITEPTYTSTLSPTETQTPKATLIPTKTPMGGGYGQIAFTSNRTGLPQIWIMNFDGTELRRITDTQQGACQPSWSPNGMEIVFISPCDTHREVYIGSSLFIINVDGTNMTPLPIIGGGDYDPAWSPDGESILFTSLRDGGIPQIFAMNLEDRSVSLLSDNEERWGMQPSWSVGGKEIIFISTRNGPYQIWTMKSDGSSPSRFSASGGKKNEYPNWSPDMQMVVFTQSETDGAIPRLFAARYPDGATSETRVYPFAGNIPMRSAKFSPDGIWLALESWPDGTNHDIYIMTPNGAERTQLTIDPAMDFDPTWRPVLP